MNNEIILIVSLAVIYGMVLVFYILFGKTGLYIWTAVATITANIEVLMVVDAFGMEQTLGNILFASTFLVTDILSEKYGKRDAQKAVKIGICVSVVFILISQSWLLYTPNGNDWASPAIRQVFANTPRLMLVSIGVYAIVQAFDVFAFHAIWEKTTKRFGDSRRGLWIRNNGSTLISQWFNTVLFNFGAFVGIYNMSTILNICVSGYMIFIVTSLADTPVVYLARKFRKKKSGKGLTVN